MSEFVFCLLTDGGLLGLECPARTEEENTSLHFLMFLNVFHPYGI